MSIPNAGPSAIITSKWDVLCFEDRYPGPGRAGASFSTRWDGSEPTPPTVDLGFGEGGVTGVEDHRSRRADCAVADRRIHPVLGRRPEDGPRRIRRPRRSRDRLSHCFTPRRRKVLRTVTIKPRDPDGESGRGRDDSRERALPGYRSTRRPARWPACVFKPASWQVLSGRGNVVSREEDRGDFWEPYKGLDGGSRIAMTNRAEGPEPRQGGLQR